MKELASGFRKRTLVTASLAGKVGVAMGKRMLLGADKSERVDAEAARAAARELVTSLGAMKGLVMKLGQMASYLPGALPDEAQRVLAELQASSVAMSYEKIAEVIQAELGAPVSELFDSFDETPFAAASIGQVHRATLRGETVAVKVQYPGIDKVLESDLSTIGFMTKMSTFGLPIDAGALVEELRSRILDECDYALEARNQESMRALFADDSDVHIPRVIADRSSGRVLTSEFVTAMRFEEFARTADQATKDRAAEVIFRTCFSGLFRHGVFNGDPHPGNYLFHADGKVTFLDFGCVRRFDQEFIETWKRLARCILDDDRSAFPDRFRACGMVGKERGFDFDAQWNIAQHLYIPFKQRTPFFTYTDAYVRGGYGTLIFDNPNQRKTAMPPEWLLLNRLQWGMNAVLAKLDATGRWPDYFSANARAPFVS